MCYVLYHKNLIQQSVLSRNTGTCIHVNVFYGILILNCNVFQDSQSSMNFIWYNTKHCKFSLFTEVMSIENLRKMMFLIFGMGHTGVGHTELLFAFNSLNKLCCSKSARMCAYVHHQHTFLSENKRLVTWSISPQVANYKQPLELLDTMDNEKKKHIVFKAIRKNTITLMTRAYGSGTGKHVYTTLFSISDRVCASRGAKALL